MVCHHENFRSFVPAQALESLAVEGLVTVRLTTNVISPATNETHVLKLNPSVGITAGGEQVKIVGVNFVTSGNCQVRFGRTEVSGRVDSSNEITCLTPHHGPGIVSVEYSSDGGNWTSDNIIFTFVERQSEYILIPVVAERAQLHALHILEEACRQYAIPNAVTPMM